MIININKIKVNRLNARSVLKKRFQTHSLVAEKKLGRTRTV